MANDKPKLPETVGHLAGNVSGIVHESYAIIAEKAPPPNAPPPHPANKHEDVRFERTDVPTSRVVIGGFAVVAGLWISTALLYVYFAFLNHHRAVTSPPPLPSAIHGHALPPQPRLQPSPPLDMQSLLVRENFVLNHYSWVDKSKGIVAIPLRRAMQIVAQRGIPPQKLLPDIVLSKPQAGTRLTGFEGKVEPEPR